MLVFVGQFQHSLDDKGRLILPAKFRREFERGGHLSPNTEGCVALWTPGEFARKSAEYLEAESSAAVRSSVVRSATGRRTPPTWSSTSRVASHLPAGDSRLRTA